MEGDKSGCQDTLKVFLLFSGLFLWCVICIAGFLMTSSRKVKQDFGTKLLTLMYDYEEVDELVEQYKFLSTIVDPRVWSQIDIENPQRAISAFKRFGQYYVHPHTVFEKDGLVVYYLRNAYINPDYRWVLEYDVRGKYVSRIDEYEITYQIDSPDGGMLGAKYYQ